ncbi:MAG: hypothetical protein GZ091_07620 [Paludibacter sp.]|nr:hypothetical protein [Paludibacter sp.]
MKKIIFAFAILISMGLQTFAQSIDTLKNEPVQYYFFVNNIPSDFNYPLIGIVNNVNGNHESVQIGFANLTKGNFGGVQLGFANTVNGSVWGLQNGFINNAGSTFKGIQNGFINNVSGSVSGFQNGFVNLANDSLIGLQTGFVNTAKNTIGVQVGFVNLTKNMIGFQHGFVNSAKKLTGVQLGFINSVDTLEAGVPIGFLSFVKHGGFSALELSTNENYWINLSFKIGTKAFYTFPVLSYNPDSSDRFALGFGFGSNISITNKFFFNPEISSSFAISNNIRNINSFNTSFGYELTNRLAIIAGPSFTWNSPIVSTPINNDIMWLFDHDFSFIDDFAYGFKCAVRYTL